MKKFIVLIMFAFIGFTTYAQEIGVRFGEVLGNNVALDMKFGRLHADVSFGNGVGVELLWDLLYGPLGSEALNYYVGLGLSALIDDPFWFGISAEAGLEYRFSGIPIVIGADWRPTFFIIEESEFDAGGFGVNIRWVFGGGGNSN